MYKAIKTQAKEIIKADKKYFLKQFGLYALISSLPIIIILIVYLIMAMVDGQSIFNYKINSHKLIFYIVIELKSIIVIPVYINFFKNVYKRINPKCNLKKTTLEDYIFLCFFGFLYFIVSVLFKFMNGAINPGVGYAPAVYLGCLILLILIVLLVFVFYLFNKILLLKTAVKESDEEPLKAFSFFKHNFREIFFFRLSFILWDILSIVITSMLLFIAPKLFSQHNIIYTTIIYLLAVISFGVDIWLWPYINTSIALLYEIIRDKGKKKKK